MKLLFLPALVLLLVQAVQGKSIPFFIGIFSHLNSLLTNATSNLYILLPVTHRAHTCSRYRGEAGADGIGGEELLRGGGDGEHGDEVRVRRGVRGGGAEPVRRARRLPPLGGLRKLGRRRPAPVPARGPRRLPRRRRPPDRDRGGGAVPVRVGPRLPDDARRRARRLLLIAANLFRFSFSSPTD
jgi:hypothetical protein